MGIRSGLWRGWLTWHVDTDRRVSSRQDVPGTSHVAEHGVHVRSSTKQGSQVEELTLSGLAAATRAGALDPEGREALLRYVLRPPLARHRVLQL